MGLIARAGDAVRRYALQTFTPSAALEPPSTRVIGGGRPIVPRLSGSPSAAEWTDLIVTQSSEWSIEQTATALLVHDTGVFAPSALLVDFMFRDDRIASCMETRVMGLQGIPFRIDGVKSGRGPSARVTSRSQKSADALQEDWLWICPPSVMEEAIEWEAMMGFALFELIWNTSGDRWVPRLKLWHPQFIYYRQDLRCYVAIAEEGVAYVTPGDGKWFLFSRHAHYRAWMRGAVRPLSVPWAGRQYGYRDWGRYNERHGAPIKLARVPFSASDVDKRAYFAAVQAMGAMGTILAAKNDKGEEFALELVEPKSAVAGGETFGGLMGRCDIAIQLILLAQNLSGGEIQGGSFAAAKESGTVRDDKKLSDSEAFGADLYWQVNRPYQIFNFGDEAFTPKAIWDAKPPEDKSKNADVFLKVMQASAIARQNGFTVPAEQLVEKYEIPIDATGEFVDETDETETDQAGDTSGDDGSAKDPTAALNGAQISSLLEIIQSVGAGAIPREVGLQLIVSAFPFSMEQAEKLMGEMGQGFKPAPPPAPAALSRSSVDPHAHVIDGQLYVDKVGDRAVKAGAKTLGHGVLDVVHDIVKRAKSYGELRAALLHSFKDMDPIEFERVVEGATKLSIGAGAFSARREAASE